MTSFNVAAARHAARHAPGGADSLSGAFMPSGYGVAPGNYAVAMGDSITSYNVGNIPENMNQGWWNHLHVRSMGRIRWGGTFATAGYKLADIQTTHLPSVLALNPPPAACFIFGASNDCSASGGVGFSLATTSATLKQIIASLRAKNIQPILTLIPPNFSAGATIQANVSLWNSYVSRLAQKNGMPILDAFTPVVDPTTGGYQSALTLDQTHPSPLGHRAIAEYNVPRLVPWFPPTQLHQSLWADPANLVNSGSNPYGMFTADSDANGLADGWGLGNTPDAYTFSLVAPTAVDDIQGNWQQVARTNAATKAGWIFRQITTGWTAGDTLELSVRVQTEGLSSDTSGNGGFGVYSRCSSPNTTWGPAAWTQDVADGLVAVPFTTPSNGADLYVYLQFGWPTAPVTLKYRFGQVTLKNLTTGGLVKV